MQFVGLLSVCILSILFTSTDVGVIGNAPAAGCAKGDDGIPGAQGAAAGSEMRPEEPAEKEELQEGYRYRPEDDRTYYVLDLPDPIGKREWQRYAGMLILGDAQMRLFEKLHTAYLEEDRRFREKEVEPLYEQSAGISGKGDLYQNLETAAQFADLISAEMRLLDPLAAIEARMFTQLEPYLTEDQLLRLERVRKQRARIRSAASGSEFPAGKLDLAWAIRELIDAGIDCTPRDAETFDATLWAYDVAATPLFERRYEKAMRILRHGVPLRVEAMVLGATATDDEGVRARARALKEEYYKDNREYALVAKRIHDLNRRYLDLFADQLPNEAAEALVTRFRDRAYPVIFPDPYDFADVLKRAAEIESLSPEERKGVHAVRIVYEQQHKAISDRMVDEYVAWHVEIITRSGYEFEPYEAYKTEMQELQEKRKEVAEVACSLLEGLFTPEEWEALVEPIGAWRKSALAFEQRGERMMEQYGFELEWPGAYD